MRVLWQDLRYGLRMLLKKPGFTAVIILTLALGIGANTTVFSGVYGMMFRPLGYPDAGRLVCLFSANPRLATANPTEGWDRSNISANDFADWRRESRSFVDMGICRYEMLNLTGADRPERVVMARASASLLPVLGFDAQIGRVFGPEEDQPGRDRVLLLASSFWKHRFGSDPGIVGQTVTLDEIPYTVLGVLPEALEGAWGRYETVWDRFDVWAPFAFHPDHFDRRDRSFRAIGRLRPGVTFAQARSELAGIADRLSETYPDSNRGYTVNVLPLRNAMLGEGGESALITLTVAVALVLLIACVNVANLTLARASARGQEFAIRAALGAGGWRLARQVLTESAILALAGGALGTLLALWTTDLVVGLLPEEVPRKEQIVLDRHVLVYALAVSVLTALLIGLAPALRTSGTVLNETLKSGARSVSAGRLRYLGLDLLAVGQLAMALALVSSAGLMVRSLIKLSEVDPGFDAKNLLTLRMKLPARKYESTRTRTAFVEATLQNVSGLPGVSSCAAVSTLPCDGLDIWDRLSVEDRPPTDPDETLLVGRVAVTPGYFEAMRIPLLTGRAFLESDDSDHLDVVIVSENLAQTLWPDEDPIGKRIKYGSYQSASSWLTVVGVVGCVKQRGLVRDARLETYRPYAQAPSLSVSLVARTVHEPLAEAERVRTAIWASDPDQAVFRVRSMEEIMSDEIGATGVITGLLGVFAVIALILAAVGLYGLMVWYVSGRTHEIGIRMALGAQRSDVLRLVLGRAARLTLAGVGGGLAAALLLGRTLEALVYGISPSDPATIAQVAVVLAAVGMLASYVPVRRAVTIDPAIALRVE